jgi:hypothetical protein
MKHTSVFVKNRDAKKKGGWLEPAALRVSVERMFVDDSRY